MQKKRGAGAIRILCWQVDGEVLATSDATPGIFARGKDAAEAARRYGEMVPNLGPAPGISFARPRSTETVTVTGTGTSVLYLGFPMDSNFGDRWVYRALHDRLPDVDLVFRAPSLEERWSLALPETRFNAFLLGGGTLINQQSHFYKETRYGLACAMPMLCFGTGVGEPERWGDHRAVWVDLLAQFRYVGVRGPRAVQLLADAGLSNHQAVGDPCLLDELTFGQPEAGALPRVALDLSFSALETRNTVTFRYLLLNWLCELERCGRIDIVLYSTWEVYVRWAEVQAEQVFGQAKPVTVIHNGFDDLPPVDLAIAYRLHAAAAALVRGIPTVVINYEDKCADFMEYLELADWVVEPDPRGFQAVRTLLEEDLSVDLGVAAEQVRTAVVAAKSATEAKFAEFRTVLMDINASDSGG